MDFKDTYGVLLIMATSRPEEVDTPLYMPIFHLNLLEKVKSAKEVFKSLLTGLVGGSNKTTTLLTVIKP